MSALARILIERGFRISGSSDRPNATTAELESLGARIALGHRAQNLGDAGTVVVSSAIAADNPELLAARERDLEVVHRGALLAHLMHERRGIAIAGTHGKTTTTAMVARVLEAGGLDPASVVGGIRTDSRTNARDGSGRYFVAEADESDRSFLGLHPYAAVVTNIENDHIDSDDEFPALVADFERFLAALPADGFALVGIDEPNAAELATRPRAARTLTFGFADGANYRAVDVSYAAFGSRWNVERDGVALGTIELTVPGRINVLDALPALAIGLELGVTFASIARALATFHGVRRRFEIVARTERSIVVDDYAHHPTAVAATIAAARENFDGPIVVAFQPHRYSRTQYLASGFAQALRGADRVVLTDVYAASEAPIAGVSSRSIGEPLAATGVAVDYVGDAAELPEYLLAHAPAGSLVLMLGAGSITAAAARFGAMIAEPAETAAR